VNFQGWHQWSISIGTVEGEERVWNRFSDEVPGIIKSHHQEMQPQFDSTYYLQTMTAIWATDYSLKATSHSARQHKRWISWIHTRNYTTHVFPRLLFNVRD
jgi:hypothetical protein